MTFRTPRERRLWQLLAAGAAAIWGSAYFLQFALDFLRQRDLLRVVLGTVFGGVALAVAAELARRRAGPRELAVIAVAAVGYGLFLHRMAVLQERLHLVEYGLVGALALAAFRERWSAATGGRASVWTAGFAAELLTIAIGWSDELVQGILPNRVYDLRDVGFNAAAGAMAILTILLAERARAADRAGRRPRPG